MATLKPSAHTTRWFFIIIAVITSVIFIWMVKGFILALITAAVFAVILAPLHRKLQKYIKFKHVSALIVVAGVFLLVLVPTFIAVVMVAQQAGDIVSSTVAEDGWMQSFNIAEQPLFTTLPVTVQEKILGVDFIEAGKGLADWAFKNLGGVVSEGAKLIFNTLIFFVALYYFLVSRDALRKEVRELSPFKDKLDDSIINRIIKTIRDVVFGALVIAIVQSVLAAIGLTIFGVPGALFWGALVIVASQIPMVGVGLIMVPAVIYLAATGHPASAIGLAIWAFTVVGFSDNILSPLVIGGRTKMPELFILISILGGLSVFGPIGFIVGPTVLALMLVLIDLYKRGILETGKF